MERGHTRRSLKCTLVILSMLLVTSVAVMPARATPDYSKIGIEAGTWAVYLSYATKLDGTYFYGGGKGQVRAYSVISVDRGVPVVNMTECLTGGGHTPWAICLWDWNISKGDVEIWQFAIPANLSAGDPPWEGSIWKINETIDNFIAAGVPRTVNHMKVHDFAGVVGTSLDIYWDRFTGLDVQAKIFNGTAHPAWLNVTLLATSLWSADSLVGGTLLPLTGSEGVSPGGGGTTLLLAGVAVTAVVGLAMGFMLGRRGRRT